MADNLFGDAFKQSVLDPGVAVGGDDEQVGGDRARGVGDLLPGPAETDHRFHGHSRSEGLGERTQLLTGALEPLFLQIVAQHRDIAKVVRHHHRLHDVQKADLGPELFGEVAGIADRLLAVGEKVHGHKNPPQMKPVWGEL